MVTFRTLPPKPNPKILEPAQMSKEPYLSLPRYRCYCTTSNTPEDECFDVHDDNMETIRKTYGLETERLLRHIQRLQQHGKAVDTLMHKKSLLGNCVKEAEGRLRFEEMEFKNHWPDSKRIPTGVVNVSEIQKNLAFKKR